MNVTPAIVLRHITDIESEVQKGLYLGNIKAVMKDQKAALVSDRHNFMTLTVLTYFRKIVLLAKGNQNG